MSDALKTPYASQAEADVFLASESVWSAASSTEKDTALQFGRYYIDANFSCPYLDEDDPSESVKFANALYALDYINGALFDTSTGDAIKSKMVKAGPVEVETQYTSGISSITNSKAEALLSDDCYQYGSTVPLVRQ